MGMTLAELTQAIRRKVDLEMEVIVAESIAEHALGFFGFSNRIIDNALEPTDRNLFYQLQDYELLTTESEETTLWDGREWRIHYWKFKPDARDLPGEQCPRPKTRKTKTHTQGFTMTFQPLYGERE